MPLLAFGTYTARIDFPGLETSGIDPIEFTYYPFGKLIILCMVGVLLYFAWLLWKRDRAYSSSMLWVFIPGIAGFVGYLFIDMDFLVSMIPGMLSELTFVFLIWRWWKPRSRIAAVVWALIASTINSIFYPIFVGQEDAIFIIVPFCSLYLICLIIPIRISIHGIVTWTRLIIGLFVASVCFSICYLFLYLYIGIPSEYLWKILLYTSFFVIPFIILIRWNAWARDIITGTMFQEISSNPNNTMN